MLYGHQVGLLGCCWSRWVALQWSLVWTRGWVSWRLDSVVTQGTAACRIEDEDKSSRQWLGSDQREECFMYYSTLRLSWEGWQSKHLEGQNWSSDMFISFLLDYSQQLSSYKSEFHLGLVFLLTKWWDDTKVANSYHLELYWQLRISKKEPKYVHIHIGLGQLPTQLSPSIQPFKEWRFIPSGSLSKRTEWLWSVV